MAQIEARCPDVHEPEADAKPSPAAQLAAVLLRVSERALVPRGERLVLLIDGLDEYDPRPGSPPGDPLAAFLPYALPPGVSVLCASRRYRLHRRRHHRNHRHCRRCGWCRLVPRRAAVSRLLERRPLRVEAAHDPHDLARRRPCACCRPFVEGGYRHRDDPRRRVSRRARRVPDKLGTLQGGRRAYTLRHADAGGGERYRIAVLRQIEQGQGEAQDAARDLIDDLGPRLVLAVGIAGGRPIQPRRAIGW